MKKTSIILGIGLSFLSTQATFAKNESKDLEEFDLDSVQYIEDEEILDLGFNTADYLPEGFDPYAFYFDVNSVEFIENIDLEDIQVNNYLPEGFDPYSNPVGIEGINFIDSNDEIVIDFNTKKFLPKGFDPYKKG